MSSASPTAAAETPSNPWPTDALFKSFGGKRYSSAYMHENDNQICQTCEQDPMPNLPALNQLIKPTRNSRTCFEDNVSDVNDVQWPLRASLAYLGALCDPWAGSDLATPCLTSVGGRGCATAYPRHSPSLWYLFIKLQVTGTSLFPFLLRNRPASPFIRLMMTTAPRQVQQLFLFFHRHQSAN